MSIERASAVADAVLFGADARQSHWGPEWRGRGDWRFGVLAPLGAPPGHLTHSRSECVVEVDAGAVLHLRVRFACDRPRPPASGAGSATPYEGTLREVDAALPVDGPPGGREVSFPVTATAGGAHGGIRAGERGDGLVTVTSTPLETPVGLVRVGVRVANRTRWRAPAAATGERVPRPSMTVTHTVLRIERGAFVSPLDPPEWAAPAVGVCRNEYTWPVLLGSPGERDLLLSSPIALADHPGTAPRDATGAVGIAPHLADPGAGRAGAPGRAPATPPAVRAITGADGVPAETLERVRGALRHLDDATGWAAAPGG
ncbi:hypothetical protein [Halostreptopolyspora alba]|uniref:Uncharacterized protein n=1 Tax=Halostreptopolyspora alba TaxID=2487137 RepID=A0A3N0E3Q6_9ACTN|nr:hypothetical protein EFW17_19360 [Nocardiopsaceae bacterium YIM 96095]